jgi:hypothetical protein
LATPSHGGVEGEAEDRPTGGHQRTDQLGHRLERVGRHLDGHRHVVPAGGEQVVAQARCGREADRVQRPVHPPPALLEVAAHGLDVGGVGDVELEDLGDRVQLACRALGEAHRPPEAGEHHLGTLLLGQASHPERQRVVGEHPGDEQLPTIEQTHGTSQPWRGDDSTGRAWRPRLYGV